MAEDSHKPEEHTVRFGEDRILRITHAPGSRVRAADVRGILAQARELFDGKALVLVDIRSVGSVDREARAVLGSDEFAERTLAQALLVETLVSRAIGNFMLGLNRTPYPTRMFTSEDKALAWLKSFSSPHPG